MSCGAVCRHGWVLPWLWHRLAARVLIRPLAWEPSYAAGGIQKKSLLGRWCLGRKKAAGKGTQENYSATWLAISGFMGMGLVSGCPWPIVLHGPYLVWLRVIPGGTCTPLHEDGFQQQESWEVGCLFPPIRPSQILQVSLQGSSMFPLRASYCGITQGSGYYHAWPKWAVTVHGLLTFPPLSHPPTALTNACYRYLANKLLACKSNSQDLLWRKHKVKWFHFAHEDPEAHICEIT